VREIMNETGEGLIKKHGLDRAEHMAHIDDLIERFGNVALADTVKRVGGDPLRKLRHEDRLVGGALLAEEYGVFPKAMCKAIAAALVFNPEGDPTAAQVQSLIAEKGAKAAFCEISGVDEGDSIVDEIMKNYNNIKS
ncbi:MAG: mannitol-1-phosphate 5-dehydrogenase, partial [Abditibacteriota bacterium]|nr:mannitol-1-phosphate 5-dehydrogenase [Abditibacteriota bacterium]